MTSQTLKAQSLLLREWRMGVKGISSGAERFLRGSISSSLLIMCEKGVLGEAFRGINPTVLGTVVAVVMQTVKNSIGVNKVGYVYA